jgi:predicted O-methyltransferase YrrM
MEGSKAVATVARNNFKTLGLGNIEIVEGNFDENMTSVMSQLLTIDFAFIDGNHRYQPTINYFNTILPKLNDSSILIFDDVHWSKEMEQAWGEIIKHPSVTLSIDLFFIGIVLFKKDFKIKQDFVVRF